MTKRALLSIVFAACSHAAPPTTPSVPAPTFEITAALAVTSSEVTFRAGDRTIPGTIVAPAAVAQARWPAVLLLAGSGPTDRDWNSPLLDTRNGSGKLLAEELARHGAVVLRFDKAASGKNPGPPLAQFTLDTYQEEALAALALLEARADVRPDRIFVAGHSEGGLHATRLALAAGPRIAGVLYLSSAAHALGETILRQLEGNLRRPMALLSEEKITAEMASLRTAFADFFAGKPVDPTTASSIPQLQQLVAGLVNPATANLTRSLLGYDNAAEAPKVRAPVLILGGGKDVQVDPDIDTRHLERALRTSPNEVTFHIAPDADHVLKHEPQTLAELRANPVATQRNYNAPSRSLDADVVATVVGWLAAHAN